MRTNRLNLKILLITVCSLSFFISCSEANKEPLNIAVESLDDVVQYESVDTPLERLDNPNLRETELKIIRNATCKLKVDEVEQATVLARDIAFRYQGYISDERFANTRYSKGNRFTIKVPRQFFDEVLDSICALSTFIDHKTVTTKDVTEEYLDVNARLKTKLDVKERYEKILRLKANTVEELLETERQLGKLQEEIDGATGRLNYLSGKVAYSTIQIDMYETVILRKEPDPLKVTFGNQAKEAFSVGWNLVKNIALILFHIWPIIIVLLFVLGYFKWYKRIRRK